MTHTRISLENIDDETFDKINVLNEWEQQQHRQNRRFSLNRFSAAGHFKDFVKWVVLVIDL